MQQHSKRSTLVSVIMYISFWSWYAKVKNFFTKMYYKIQMCLHKSDKCQPKWYNKQLFLCLSGLICTLQSTTCCQIRWSYFTTTLQIVGINVSFTNFYREKNMWHVTAINIFADVRFLHMTDIIYNNTSIIFIVSHD